MSHLKKQHDITLNTYSVWDKPSRLFHWINALLVLILTIVGLIMLFKGEFGITELSAKIGLKRLHVYIGYAFTLNLLIRLVWGFIGNKYARFRHIMPNSRTLAELKDYQAKLNLGQQPQYLGHNPKGKLAVLAMMLLLVVIMLTGLFRAGTDIYYPPLGGTVQQYLAETNVNPDKLKPYDNEGVNPEKAAALKPMKGLAGSMHVYSVYLLLLLIVLHIIAVIYTERRQQPGIISAMFSGKKWIQGEPQDKR